MPQARHWAFTIQRGNLLGRISTLDDWYREAQSMTSGVKYLVYQIEVAPKTGTEHIQGFVSFSGQKRESTLANHFGKVHAACFQVMMKGATPWDNKLYCTKDDSRKPGTVPFEYGQVPVPNAEAEAAEMSKLDQFIELCKATNLFKAIDAMPSTYIRNCNGIQKWWEHYCRQRASKDRNVNIIVCYGNSGAGKSAFAHNYDTRENTFVFPALEAKQRLNLDGYQGQRTVVIDEFKGQIDYGTFKNLTDRYCYEFNTKGSMTLGVWTTMIITSNYHPNTWYEGQDHWGIKGTVTQSPLQRRYDSVWHFVGNLQPDGTGTKVHDYEESITIDWSHLPTYERTHGAQAGDESAAPPAGGSASSNPPDAPKQPTFESVGDALVVGWEEESSPTVEQLVQEWEQQDEALQNDFIANYGPRSPLRFDRSDETERMLLQGEEGDGIPDDGWDLF